MRLVILSTKSSFILMYFSFFLYSLSSIFTKLASNYSIMSWQYILCFVAIIAIMGIYAILWQQVLKKVQLSVAMANRPVTLVFASMWAVLLFGEKMSALFLVGFVLIVAGLLIIGTQND